jgi:predicted transcriptional regulator
LSLERVIDALIDNGLLRIQAEIYVYLAKKGPKTIECLTKILLYNRKEIEKSLKELQSKGLVTRNQVMFCALPFEEALTHLIETKKEQSNRIEENKKELLTLWKKEAR